MHKEGGTTTAFFIREPITATILAVIEAQSALQARERFEVMRWDIVKTLRPANLMDFVAIEPVGPTDTPRHWPIFPDAYFDALEAATALKH